MFKKKFSATFLVMAIGILSPIYGHAAGLTIPPGHTVSVNSGKLNISGDMNNNGSLLLSSSPGTEIKLDGNWVNNGSFIANGGTVTLNSSFAQQVTTGGAASAFNTLIIQNTNTAGVTFTDALFAGVLNADSGTVKKLSFTDSATHTISSNFNVSGSGISGSVNEFTALSSTSPGTNWNIDAPHLSVVNYTNVSDSYMVAGNMIGCNSTDSGNNTNWYFVTCIGTNAVPVAEAGADQTIHVGLDATLDGSGSWDANGDELTFNWVFTSIPEFSTAILNATAPVFPSFTLDIEGNYTVELVVVDKWGVASNADAVIISTSNSKPVANAGNDQSVYVTDPLTLVTLNGSNSTDPDGDSLTFNWSLVARPSDSLAALDNAGSVNPTFTADKSGNYTWELIVNDGWKNSDPDQVTVSTLNSKPIADAGGDQSAYVGDTVNLNGGNSWDVDGDPLTYSWSFTARPEGSLIQLVDAGTATPHFDIDIAGDYVVQLLVNDGKVNSEPDTVTISTTNVAPVANAGNNDSVLVGDLVLLDGSGSSDPDNDPITYSWSFTTRPAGSAATLANPGTVSPSFTADMAGTYIVSLIVSDNELNDTDSVTITATVSTSTIIDIVRNIITQVNLAPKTVFNNPNNQKALTNKLNTVIQKLNDGDNQDALKKLQNDILKKTDGCASSTETLAPDKNDWIKDCATQDIIYPLLLQGIQLLS